jgi:hypothetical protein
LQQLRNREKDIGLDKYPEYNLIECDLLRNRWHHQVFNWTPYGGQNTQDLFVKMHQEQN